MKWPSLLTILLIGLTGCNSDPYHVSMLSANQHKEAKYRPNELQRMYDQAVAFYYTPNRTAQETYAAWAYFHELAREGHPESMRYAGLMRANGDYQGRDVIGGLMWLNVAARHGNEEADIDRAGLILQMNMQQAMIASRLTKACMSEGLNSCGNMRTRNAVTKEVNEMLQSVEQGISQ